MPEFFYEADHLAFQHHTLNALQEVRYRLHDLTTWSRRSIAAFHDAVKAKSANVTHTEFGSPVKYSFSAALAPLQTLRDLLQKVIPGFKFDTFLSAIPDGEMFRQLRHAIVHDGQPAVALYVDGRFFVAVNIRRTGQNRKIEILAPHDDVETATLRFYEEFCRALADEFATMKDEDKLCGPAYSVEWFQEAVKHPSLKRFKLSVPERDLAATQTQSSPLNLAHEVTLEIAQNCRLRLEELAAIPPVNFP